MKTQKTKELISSIITTIFTFGTIPLLYFYGKWIIHLDKIVEGPYRIFTTLLLAPFITLLFWIFIYFTVILREMILTIRNKRKSYEFATNKGNCDKIIINDLEENNE